MKKLLVVCAVCAIVGSPLAAFAGILIDDFAAPAFSYELAFSGDTYSRTDSGLNVIGGSRTINYTQLVSAGGGDSVSMYQMAGGGSKLSSSNGCGGVSYFELMYDSLGAGLDADFSAEKSLQVNWNPDHLGFMKPNFMSFTLADTAGHSYEDRIDWTAYWANQGPDMLYSGTIDLWNGGTYTYSYIAPGPGPELTTLFNLQNFSSKGVDLSNINSILFKYESDVSNDLYIGKFTATTPEPATMALFGVGLAGLFFRRKKLRRNYE